MVSAQLLRSHRLQRHAEVEGRDRDLRDLLEWIDEAFLADPDLVHTHAGDGEVGVGLRDMVAGDHLGGDIAPVVVSR